MAARSAKGTRKQPIPVTIVTGPQGAGKTSLINRVLASPPFAESAVILNDFGAVALAGAVAAEAAEDVMALGAGCVCCTVRGALADALENVLRDLDNRRRATVGRIVIEAAATADPAAVVAQVAAHPYLSLRFVIDGIVSVIDAPRAEALLAGDADTVRQLAMADVIAVTGPADTALVARLKALNPLAAVVEAVAVPGEDLVGFDGSLPSDDALETWKPGPAPAVGEAGRIHVFTVARPAAMSLSALDRFLEYLSALQGPRLMRLVGQVATGEGDAVSVAGIGGLFLPPLIVAGQEGTATRFLVVGRDFDQATFAGYLDAFLNHVAVDTPDRAALTDNPLSIAGFSARPGKR